MGAKYTQIFSEYDIEQWGIQFANDASATIMDTLGTAEETAEVRTVTKQKRNMPWKTRTKATGSGEVKVTAHIREDVYAEMFGMFVDGYKPGVMVYGTLSVHKQFCMTEKVVDEDGVIKYKAYPCCTVKEGMSRKVETNAEEIAEVELTIAFDPDENGIGVYSIVKETDTDPTIYTNWMSNFDSSLLEADELGALTVTSTAGTATGDTAVAVTPALTSGNSYRYKVETTVQTVTYGQDVSSWTAWDGDDDITAQTGKKITVVECNSENKARKVGSATVTAKS